jgi:hypothetical protein
MLQWSSASTRPITNGTSPPCTETYEIVNQSKKITTLSSLCQVFCHSNERLTNIIYCIKKMILNVLVWTLVPVLTLHCFLYSKVGYYLILIMNQNPSPLMNGQYYYLFARIFMYFWVYCFFIWMRMISLSYMTTSLGQSAYSETPQPSHMDGTLFISKVNM